MTDDLRAQFDTEALPHLRAVFNVARRLTGRDDQAQDLAQDTFLRAFDKFGGFTAGTNCRAWLFTITYSLFINHYRRQQREPKLVSTVGQDPLLESRVPAPESSRVATPARAAAAADVEGALAQLPEEYRAAIMLVDAEDLSYEDAAAVLGCPIGTVRSRLCRGRTQLANALHDYDIAGRQGR